MDTPTITQYYRESDPARRLALLNMSIEAGEEPELNQIRRELWDIRYQDPSELGGDTRADGLIALWMLMEFNKDSGKRFMGVRGGRKEIMDLISPCGPVYQAGTLSGNPVAMAAGFTQLKYLYEHQEIYKDLAAKGEKLYGGLKKIVEEKGLPYQVNYDSSLASIFFTDQEVKDYVSAKTSNLDLFAKYFKGMLKRGIHLAPSQFEAMFLSTAHTDEVIDETLEAMRGALGDL